ncbi:MAG: hypothetical protein ACOC92_00015 [bacterium]
MKHRQAIEYLSELGTGSLDANAEEALASHAERCPRCRDWLATRDLLAEGLGRDRSAGGEHPDSELLALCVLRPEEVDESDREELRSHLRRCPVCQEDMALTREAVQGARPGEMSPVAAPRPRVPVLPRRRAWVAAALVVVSLGGGLLLHGYFFDRLGPADTRLDEVLQITSPRSQARVPTEELSGRDLDGTQIIRSDQDLVVSKLTVQSGADVTFRAGRTVAFGDGFRVAKDARIRVGSGPAADPGTGNGTTKTNREPSGDRVGSAGLRGPN